MRVGRGAEQSFASLVDEFLTQATELVVRAGVERPPVDPRKLAALRGIQHVVLSSSLTTSGQLLRHGDQFVIRLNRGEPVERQNFSCCHEIAHTFSVHSAATKFRDSFASATCRPYGLEEYLCDRAAGEMLMPSHLFHPMAARLDPSIASVIELSKMFSASVAATIVRIGQLSVWRVVFVVWRFMTRPGSYPKLRVSWAVRPSGHRCFVPRYAPTSPGSGIYAAFIDDRLTSASEELDLGGLRGKFTVESKRFGNHVVSLVHDPMLKEGA